jgi:Na+-translocating ferredoxin:NAD+ oxidoreductase subunit G
MKASIKLIVTLFLVCGIAAGSLAFVNAATKERIAANAAIERKDAQNKVFPNADEFIEMESYEKWTAQKLDEKSGSVFTWAAVMNGEPTGYILQTSVQGYGGPIKLIFGVDLDGRVTGLRILTHSETPGFGAKITKEDFLSQYLGKGADQMRLKKDDPAKGAIDAISGATISSRAVTKAVATALSAALGMGTDAISTATSATSGGGR